MKTILKNLDVLIVIIIVGLCIHYANQSVTKQELKEYEAIIESENVEAREFLKEASYKIVVEHPKNEHLNELGAFEKESGVATYYNNAGELTGEEMAICDTILYYATDYIEAIDSARDENLVCQWEEFMK